MLQTVGFTLLEPGDSPVHVPVFKTGVPIEKEDTATFSNMLYFSQVSNKLQGTTTAVVPSRLNNINKTKHKHNNFWSEFSNHSTD